MRHILIIFSILLLGCVKNQTSTEFVQGTEFLYQYETSSGLIFKSFGDGKVQPKYKGEITNGKPNGFGVLTYPYGEKSVVGEWKNGKEWNTKHTKNDGTLIGRFENGEWNLFGRLYRGKRNGKNGYFTYPTKEEFDRDDYDTGDYWGGIKNGLPNGTGGLFLFNGKKFHGEFRDGRYWNGDIIYYHTGKIFRKVVNGEWLRVKKD